MGSALPITIGVYTQLNQLPIFLFRRALQLGRW